MKRLDVLKKARKLVSDREKWTVGAAARMVSGHVCGPTSGFATSFCALGAVACVARDDDDAEFAAVQLLRKFAAPMTVAQTNDAGDHKAVLALFDRAIAYAEKRDK